MYAPRETRSTILGRRAYEIARLAGASVMTAACAQIDAEFGEASRINDFKRRVQRMIALGTGHPAVKARYRSRVNMLRGYSLNTAIMMVERWYKQERAAHQIASAFCRPPRLSLEVLEEMRLILRLIRASHYRDHFAGIVAFVLAP